MNTDAVIFLREMREAFGEGMTIERAAPMSSKIRVMDSEDKFDQLCEWAKRTGRDWFLAGKPTLEVVVRLHEEARTLDQNSRMWAMLALLEQHATVCEATGRPMNQTAWHDFLRIKYGFVHGTRTVPIPNGAGGYSMIECPNPQPTRKGAAGQMTKAQHSEYMERIADELEMAGIHDDYAGTMGVEQAA